MDTTESVNACFNRPQRMETMMSGTIFTSILISCTNLSRHFFLFFFFSDETFVNEFVNFSSSCFALVLIGLCEPLESIRAIAAISSLKLVNLFRFPIGEWKQSAQPEIVSALHVHCASFFFFFLSFADVHNMKIIKLKIFTPICFGFLRQKSQLSFELLLLTVIGRR